MVDCDAGAAFGLGVDERAEAFGVADRGHGAPATASEVKRARHRNLLAVFAEGADHERVARGTERDAGDRPADVEIGLDRRERALVRKRGEHRVRAKVAGARDGRKPVTEAHEALAAEREVQLSESEPVLARDLEHRAARLRHELGPDAVAGEARNRVARHAATSSNTSASVTTSPESASDLKRANADCSSPGARSIPAASHAFANAWRPECLPSGSVIARPSSAGSTIWYVRESFSMPSWWIPASCANAFAPTTALFGWTT